MLSVGGGALSRLFLLGNINACFRVSAFVIMNYEVIDCCGGASLQEGDI